MIDRFLTLLNNMTWAATNIACGILRRRRNGNRMLLVTGDNVSRTQWLDLTYMDNTGIASWSSFVTPAFKNYFATMISLSPYETYEVNILTINIEISQYEIRFLYFLL